jgi:putative hemolysin
MAHENSTFSIKLAISPEERQAAQRLRYRVFVEELGAVIDAKSDDLKLECDEFDNSFDHLILQDKSLPKGNDVVGSYRLLRSDVAKDAIGFYSAREFDLGKIISSGRKSVELGRSCVDVRYRNGMAMHLLWKGVADYVRSHGIEVLFGVASFQKTDPNTISHALSFLHHGYLSPEDLRVSAYGATAIPLDILAAKDVDKRRAVMQTPSLIKSYLRLGGTVGYGAFIDHAFKTIDVCLVMDTARMTQKYKTVYERDNAA